MPNLRNIVYQSEGAYYGVKEQKFKKIGRTGVRVHVVETAICNGLVIVNFSSELDNLPGVQWIVGGVVEGNCKKFGSMGLFPPRKYQWDYFPPRKIT